MQHWIVQGDSTDHGGTVLQGDPRSHAQDQPMARVGDMVACPQCKGVFPIISGKSSMLGSNDQPFALPGDKTACGASLISRQQSTVISAEMSTPRRPPLCKGSAPPICLPCLHQAAQHRSAMLLR